MISEGHRHPELVEFYWDNVIAKGLASIGGILERGISTGEFRKTPVTENPQLIIAPALFAVQHDITSSLRSATVVISRLLSKRRPRFASTAQPVAADPPLADEGA